MTRRPFRYVLEPVRMQREWRLTAAQSELAQLVTRLDECEREIVRLEACRACDAEAGSNLVLHAGPRAAMLAHLVGLQRRIKELDTTSRELRDAVAEARRTCVARDRDLQALEQHREAVSQAAALEARRVAAAQADADWIARTHVREELR